MISRIVTTAALVAGSILLYMPVQAQTGTSGQGTGSSNSSTSTTGSMGGGTQNSSGMRGSGMNNSGTNSSGMTSADTNNSGMNSQSGGRNMAAQGGMNGQMNRSAGIGDMNERQMTECLNNAAAKGQSLGSCRR